MIEPSLPRDETKRLAALINLDLVDTPAEERFDRITRFAARLFGVPIALISLVDADRQWFKSRHGLAITDTPRNVSFCGHAILGEGAFVVPDARRDPRFADNPLVACAEGFRFYAGYPLSAPDGSKVGTLCIIDRRPREIGPEELEALTDLAHWAQCELLNARLHQALAMIHDSEARLRAVVDNALDAIITINAAGTIESFNPAADYLLRTVTKYFLGRGLNLLMPEPYHSDPDGYRAYLSYRPRSEVIGGNIESVARRRDGSTFPMELSISKLESGGAALYTGIVRDVSDRKKAEAELRERGGQLDAIFTLSPDGLVAFGADGRVTYVNDAFLQMTGFAADKVLGLPSPEFNLLLESMCDPGFGADSAASNGGLSHVLHLSRPQPRALKCSVCEARGPNVGTVMYFRDVTHEAEVARIKSEFLSTAAHELRTPMASIYGYSELLLKRKFSSREQREMLEVIYSEAGHLSKLLNELLDLARIEARAGKDFNIGPCRLNGIIRRALAATLVPDDPRKVDARLMPENPVVVVDPEKLQQALVNVLSNAYKYSPGGGPIKLRVKRGRRGREREIGIVVRDIGIGMTQEQLARIFERFYRADTSGRIPGSGLGMSLVKEITDAFGGSVDVKSQAGKGTEVALWLPLAAGSGR